MFPSRVAGGDRHYDNEASRLQYFAGKIFRATDAYSNHPVITFGHTPHYRKADERSRLKRVSFKSARYEMGKAVVDCSRFALLVKEAELSYLFPHSKALNIGYEG